MKQTRLSITILCASLLLTQQAHAFSWTDLWTRPDQQGAKALRAGKPQQAAKLFENPQWRGTAEYKAKRYQQAVDNFAAGNTANAYYNRGNALAHLGRYQDAIKAYDQALKLSPKDNDALFNRNLVKKLLKQQKKQSKNNKNQKQKKQQQQAHNNQSQHKKNENNKNQNNQKQQNQDQKNQQQNQGQQNQQSQSQQTQQQQQKPTQKNQQQAQTKQKAKQNKHQPDQQAMQQWLQRIPDDPGGLLRQKFLRDHQRLQAQGRHSITQGELP